MGFWKNDVPDIISLKKDEQGNQIIQGQLLTANILSLMVISMVPQMEQIFKESLMRFVGLIHIKLETGFLQMAIMRQIPFLIFHKLSYP
jgi:hypothetical protein